jgi:transcriptional regulator with XRE-family HTH domain
MSAPTQSGNAHRFGELLRQAREQANQTAEVMAILLSMEQEDYLAIEAGLRFPDEDTVRRLCMMMEWNYNETKRHLRNEMSAPGRLTAPPIPTHRGLLGQSNAGGTRPDSLAGRLRQVRQVTGQSADIIAALLHIAPDQYQQLEEGAVPSDDLLRRISMVYNWNFQELVSLMRAEQAHNLQPRLVGNPFPATGQRFEKLKNLCRELEALFAHLPDAEQTVLLAQLDLIRGTMARHRQSAPSFQAPSETPQSPATGSARRKAGALPLMSSEDRKLFS